MFYSALSILLGLIGLASLLAGLRMLLRRGWVLGWLRGMAGLCLLLAAIGLGLVALDVRSYHSMQADRPIATVSFEKLDNQRYRAIFVATDSGAAQQFELRGDQWQLDARIVHWQGLLRAIGGKPGYRLDRISGRYLSLDEERSSERTVYSLADDDGGIDFWDWVYQREWVPWVAASYSSARFLPMAEGALFEVGFSAQGLMAKPLNTPAEQAVYYRY